MDIVAARQQMLRGGALRNCGSKAGKAWRGVQGLDKQEEHFRLVGERPRRGQLHPACATLPANLSAAWQDLRAAQRAQQPGIARSTLSSSCRSWECRRGLRIPGDNQAISRPFKGSRPGPFGQR